MRTSSVSEQNSSTYFLLVCEQYQLTTRGRYYLDGFLWSSLFVPWRCFSPQDRLIRVSVRGMDCTHCPCEIP